MNLSANTEHAIIVECVGGDIQVTVVNADGDAVIHRKPEKEISLLLNTARELFGPASEYFASRPVPDGQNRLCLIIIPQDPSTPEVLMHLKFEEVE